MLSLDPGRGLGQHAAMSRISPSRLRILAWAWCTLAALLLAAGLAHAGWDRRSLWVMVPLQGLGLGGMVLWLLAPPFATVASVRRFLDRPQGLILALAPLALLDLSLPLFLPDLPWTNTDSWEFMGFEPWRTLGYGMALRLMATILPTAMAMVWLQVAGTVAAILFLAETLRRVTRDGLAAAVAGFLLLASWPFFIYAFHLLAEQLFLISILVHFTATARAFEEPRPVWLWIMAASAMVAIVLRPAGHFLFMAVPLLMLLRPGLSRRILAHMGVPMIAAALALAGAHHYALGIFGLSSFAGLTLSSNMLYLAKPDTASSDPELMARFAEHAASYRAGLDVIPGGQERFDEVRRAAAPLSNWALATAARRLGPGGTAAGAQAEAMLDRAAGLSALNALYSEASRMKRPWQRAEVLPVWQEVNAHLTRLAMEVFAHDPWETLRFTAWKMAWGWREVLPMFSMRRNLGPNEYLAPNRPDEGYRLWQKPERYESGTPQAVATLHDAFAALPLGLSLVLPLPLIILAAGIGAPLWCAARLVRRRPVPAAAALAAYAGLTLLAYHAEVAFAQVGLARFLTAGMPMAVLLLVLPLAMLRKS